MTEKLQRILLSDQVYALVKQRIQESQWAEELPGERTLCREFHVSRVTLRKALAQLKREGWVQKIAHGRGQRILKSADQTTSRTGTVVRVLTPYALFDLGSLNQTILAAFSSRLAEAGFRMELENHPSLFKRHRTSELKRLISLPDTAGWVLMYAHKSMQTWFADLPVPCVAIGQVDSELSLSCVHTDHEAVARHAAGKLASRGHTQLVYFKSGLSGLWEEFAIHFFSEEAQSLGAAVKTVVCPDDVGGICRIMDGLMRSSPRPTAFFSGCPEHCITVLCYLKDRGFRVPEDVAVLSGGSDLTLNFTVPPLSHYKTNGQLLGQKAAETILGQIVHGHGKILKTKILPEYIPGGSLNDATAPIS